MSLPPMEMLIHLIYTSAATTEPSTAALVDILSASRRNNSRVSVTGMLLYTQDTFFQVLEGPAPAAR